MSGENLTKAFAKLDLKLSLWGADRRYWEEQGCGDTYTALEAAFSGAVPAFTVYTAPKKEIRFGTVTVSKGRATVDFRTVWDSPRCHVPEHVEAGEAADAAADIIHDYFCDYEGYDEGDPESPIGARVTRTLQKRPRESFRAFMGRIDKCEDELLKVESEHSLAFERWLKLMFPDRSNPCKVQP